MKTGIFGGTFNPVHLGHLRVAEEVADELGLERVIFVPVRIPPHKPSEGLAPPLDRYEAIRIGIEGNPRFDVSNVEIGREGPSYSVDTIEHFSRELAGGERIWFILGVDAFNLLHTWKRFRDVLAKADLAVMSRSEEPRWPNSVEGLEDEFEHVEEGLRHVGGCRVRFIKVSHLEISSTMIRQAMARGTSLRYLVPEPVREFLEKSSALADYGENYA